MKKTYVGGNITTNVNGQEIVRQVRPTYKSKMFCMFETFRDQTNNKLEGFHNGLNYNQQDYPNVYALIPTLRKLQLSNEQLVESMDNGSNPTTNRRPKYVQIDQKL